MLVYEGTKSEFLNDVLTGTITEKIHERYKKFFGKSGISQINSWNNSMTHMHVMLSDNEIPDNSGVAIEFNIPTTSKRIDFILSGYNQTKEPSVIIIELKQWNTCNTVEGKDGLVQTYIGGGLRETTHPSYQAWSYASLIKDYNETVWQSNIDIIPCAYLHNYSIKSNDPLVDEKYHEYLHEAPVFGKGDAIKLRDFIKQHVVYGDNRQLLYEIENGRIRPSKRLQDTLASMLQGNTEFIMIDEQKVIYEDIVKRVKRIKKDDAKQIYIIQGGPGTGKTVLAINLLVEFTQREMVCNYVTKNSAPRNVFYSRLKGQFKQNYVQNLFKGSGNYCETDSNTYDVLIVDEAHRLSEKSGLYANQGEHQIKEIINSSRLSIFFIDEDQRVTIKDVGDIDTIRKFAKEFDADISLVELESQFRCNGSTGYLSWIDNILDIKQTANYDFDFDYDFRVIDDPNELRNLIQKNNDYNKARLVAGYCWDWLKTGKNRPDIYDIEIPEYDFKMSWNLGNTSTWAIDRDSVNEVGCIHTSQGLEFDYIGVIIGDDIRYENGRIVTDYLKRARTDQSLKGIKKLAKVSEDEANLIADRIIKNTYRTLMTRGIKGCYVYCVDRKLQEYFKHRLCNKLSN